MFKGSYSDLWKAIIRPPRDEYMISNLGPKEFKLDGRVFKRIDMTLKNNRGLILECSHYKPAKPPTKEMPCVIYLHGNSSSRVEALQAVEVLLPANITLFCFDFAGCGKSEGEYISLGYYEKDDVECVMKHLRDSGEVSTIGLWGRSMGAVTALMHADRDPSIAGIVLDSPFSDMRLLAEELVKQHSSIPKFIVSGALGIIKKTIKSKAKFDLDELKVIKTVDKAFVPAYFVHATGDDFIDKHHTADLYEKYGGEKKITYVDGDHNSARPQYFLDSVAIFFYNTLLVEQLVPVSTKVEDKSKDKMPKGGFRDAYIQHSEHLQKQNVGNNSEVENLLGDFDENELEKAIKESMKLAEGGNGEKGVEEQMKNLGINESKGGSHQHNGKPGDQEIDLFNGLDDEHPSSKKQDEEAKIDLL